MTDPTPATPDEAVSQLEHSDPLYRPLMLAVRDADESFQKAGGAGTKTWLDDHFLPRLAEHGLTLSRQQGDTVAARDCACRKRHCVWGTSATSTTRILGDCMASADGFTADRIAAILMARPYVIGRARIQHAEAARIACDLWDALTEVPA